VTKAKKTTVSRLIAGDLAKNWN